TQEGAMELEPIEKAQVCLYVNAAMRDDLHHLYCRRNPLHILVYCVFGLAFLSFPIYFEMQLEERILSVFFALIMFILAFGILPIWWRWYYWPAVQRNFPESEPVCGEITAEGIAWATNEVTRFQHSCGAKMNERAVLLFFSKSYAL